MSNFCLNTSWVVAISIFTSIEYVQLRLILKIFSMSLDWYSQLNYLLIKVVTLLILSLDHKSLKYVLFSVSTSDHNWLNFDCLKYLLENGERSVVKFRNWKNVERADFNEDCFYHLWSIEGSPLIDSFLETSQTISDKHAPEMERVISKHDCFFYDNELRACKRKRRQLERLFRKTRSTIDRLHMQSATENYFKLFHKKRSRFLETKLKFEAIETLLGSKKKQTLPSVFPRVKLANKFNDFFYPKYRIFFNTFRHF